MSEPSEVVPKSMQAKYDEVVGITDAFCADHLNEGYAEFSRRMTAKLARKRPSPLLSGNAVPTMRARVIGALSAGGYGAKT